MFAVSASASLNRATCHLWPGGAGMNNWTTRDARMKVAKDMRVQIALSLPREEISVPLTRHVVSAALLTAGVEPSCVHEVELALSEACTNAVKHAVEGISYEVMVGISDEQVAIDVVDSGSGFGQRHVSTDVHDHWAENGRGVALINTLSDLAIFDSVEGEGGSVHMTKALRWVQGTQRPGPTLSMERPR
jgi:anti-sigma regulatory factor (Ser/Thr protein kinase)